MSMIENLESMLAKGQDNVLLRFGLGNEYLKEGRHAEAAEQLRRALEHDPAYSVAWKLLGKALTGLGDSAGAIDAYEKGLAAAEERGDKQAAKEMTVFLKRLRKS
jgi:Tfp pilus assembly protein PilF